MENAKLLNTEFVSKWLVRRTYRIHGESTLVTTFEVPETVIRTFGFARALEVIEKYDRGRAKRKGSAIRKNAIIEGHEAGKNQSQIAKEVGCSPAYVAHIIEMMS